LIKKAGSTSPQSLNMTDQENREKELIRAALKLLSIRDYFSCELAGKLSGKGATSSEIEKTMEYINRFKYIDDDAVLNKYSEELAGKLKGFYYLKKKLFEKGCSELIEKYDLRKYYTKEMENQSARKCLEKLSGRDRTAIQRSLVSKGYSLEIIVEILRDAG
jgi:SOS response regulatory protein OraA/RecX